LLLKRLDKNNSDLRALLGHNMRMEILTLKKTSPRSGPYNTIRECACSIQKALEQSFSSPCSHFMQHNVHLQLDPRHKPTYESEQTSPVTSSHELVLRFSHRSNNTHSSTSMAQKDRLKIWMRRDALVRSSPCWPEKSQDEHASLSQTPPPSTRRLVAPDHGSRSSLRDMSTNVAVASVIE
jgi:hypothetical protein